MLGWRFRNQGAGSVHIHPRVLGMKTFISGDKDKRLVFVGRAVGMGSWEGQLHLLHLGWVEE